MEWYHDVLPGRLLACLGGVGCDGRRVPVGPMCCWAVGGWGRRAALSPPCPPVQNLT